MTDTRFSRDNLPADGWVEYRKTQTTPMVRVDGPFTVVTREGPLHCEDGYLACPADGWPYPVAADYHDANYEPAAALPTPPAEASREDALRTELHAIYVDYLDRYCDRRINHRDGDYTPAQAAEWTHQAHARFVETYPAAHAFRFPGEATDG